MADKEFVHLHTHTEYSLLDGSGKISKIISRAKELGMDSLAITDHGAMYGCVDFYKEAKAQGIKPIIGCEVYVAEQSRYNKEKGKAPGNATYHLVLLVKNQVGYQNLMEIVSDASIEGFYYKPRTDHEFLKTHSEGLIALSACLAGEVQNNIIKGNRKKAVEAALFYKNTFKDGFYLELQYHGMSEQLRANEEIVNMAKELDIPLVATNDVHYIKKEDAKAHDVLLCIQTSKTVQEKDRMRYPSDEFYLKSPDEMYDIFQYEAEALKNTVKIANQCNFDYEFHTSKLPNFPLPEGTGHYEYLKELCYKGLKSKYEYAPPGVQIQLQGRLEYELGIIKNMGYVDYFLIVWDFIRFANESNIITGPGRGSAAGSIVAYTLGITKIDPIKYNLIFERFLNPDRISMPDIDSDFCYERRQEVIDYVVAKYGKDNVTQIITFGTMAARACIRDVGRAMNYSYAEVDKVAKMIPSMPNITIDKALEINTEFNEIYEEDDRIKELIDVAKALEGLPRHTSTHAAGVVIASQPMVNFVPLQKNEGMIVTQFTMGTIEELGLLKMDFLGLRTLTVIRDALEMIKQNHGIKLDIDEIGFEDRGVYKMIGEGKTVGVFQLESSGMTSFMKDLKPDSLEDIIAGISLYRPGPMSEIPRYIKNKKSSKEIEYETPELKHILDVTYGCMVYQEQVMQIVRDLAGYSMGRSDLVRRAMSKKKHKVMEEERHNFIYGIIDENDKIQVPGCIRNGIKAEAANKIFDSMMDFASYAFNKSHAAAYAVVAYETAYLMYYYPTEFIAAMLNSIMGVPEKVAYYIRFAESSDIKILLPDINESYAKFTVKDRTIRFGLAAVKNAGVNVIESIVKSREEKGKFISFSDFCNKVDLGCVNKRAVESLIKVGAFDNLGARRSQLLAIYEMTLDGVNSERKRNIQGQISLFGVNNDSIDNAIEIKYPEIKEFQKKYLLSMEKEMTGLYLSGHPLEEYEKVLSSSEYIQISEIVTEKTIEEDGIQEDEKKFLDGRRVKIGGIITSITKKITKNNAMMAFINLEDLLASIEVVIFPKTFERYKECINVDGLVTIKGRISIREEEQPKIICEDIEPLENSTPKENKNGIYILIENGDTKNVLETKEKLKPILNVYKGNIPVYLCTLQPKRKYVFDKELWTDGSDKILNLLINMFGEQNVKDIKK